MKLKLIRGNDDRLNPMVNPMVNSIVNPMVNNCFADGESSWTISLLISWEEGYLPIAHPKTPVVDWESIDLTTGAARI